MNGEVLKDELNIVLHNYCSMSDCPLVLSKDVPAGNADEEVLAVNAYGLYSFRVETALEHRHFKISVENLENGAERQQVVDSSEDMYKSARSSINEYISKYNEGFIFYEHALNEKVRIVLETGGVCYRSVPVLISFGTNSDADREISEKEQLDMILKIYHSQPLLLVSAFQKSPLAVYIGENSRIRDSVDTRLELMRRCIDVYNRQYSDIRRSLKFRLKASTQVDRIDKLTSMTPDTLSYMVRNPQHLIKTKRGKGIVYNGAVYLPQKTLVTRNVVDHATYENCYILSFLKMLIHEAERLKIHLRLGEQDAVRWFENSAIKSQRADFENLIRKYQLDFNKLCGYEKNMKRLFDMYRTAFGIGSETRLTAKIVRPKVTAIFRQIPEYNVFLRDAFDPWFKNGINMVDDANDQLVDAFVTAVSNPSTTYELYIVCCWIDYMTQSGYTFVGKEAKYAGVHEKESRYTDYAYEFVFVRDGGQPTGDADKEEYVTLYYSPSVYLPTVDKSSGEYILNDNNVDDMLYRNTRNSMVSREDKETNGVGAHYEPDFIIKYRKGSVVRYVMADAKHKNYNEVLQDEMPKLVYKYLNSIRTKKLQGMDARIAGLCAVYHKHSDEEGNGSMDGEDYFEFDNDNDQPFVKMLYMSVSDEDSGWEKTFESMLSMAKIFRS